MMRMMSDRASAEATTLLGGLVRRCVMDVSVCWTSDRAFDGWKNLSYFGAWVSLFG